VHALCQMTFAQKKRHRWRHIELNRHSCNGKKRGYVLIAIGSQPHDLRIDELFTREPGLGQKPPYSRMKPEHRRGNLFDNRHEPIPASNMKQFMTCNSVLPYRS